MNELEILVSRNLGKIVGEIVVEMGRICGKYGESSVG